MTSTDVAAKHSWSTAKLTAEWWGVQTYCTAPSMLSLQFLTVRTGVNTLVGTNQDKKSPGTHLGLTLWLSSALRVPICSFPASWEDNPLRTVANWSGSLTLDVSDLEYKSLHLPFVWRNHPKLHLIPQTAFQHLQRRTALICGGKGRKGVRPLNGAIEMWRRQWSLEFSKPRVRMHYSTLQR